MSKEKPDKEYDIIKAWSLLREDFASRENNTSTYSGLGGDLSKFLFVLFNNIKLVPKSNSITKFVIEDSEIQLRYSSSSYITVKELRNQFDNFYSYILEDASKMPPYISKDLVADYEYMSQFKGKSFHIDTFLQALNKTERLSVLLNDSVALRETLQKRFLGERKVLISHFAKDNDVYVNLEEDFSELIEIIERHDVYAAKLKDIRDREAAAINAVFGYEERTIMTFLGSVPVFLVVIPFRHFVGIENMIKYDLDEYFRASDV
jgi:hypothetical protein